MSNPDDNKTINIKEKKKMYNKKYYEAKKAKIQNEKVENEKKEVVIETTTKQIEELRQQFTKQLTDIQITLARLISNQLTNETEDEKIHKVPPPIKRYMKSIETKSTSSYTTQQSESEESEDESIISEEDDSSFEIEIGRAHV